MQPLKRWRGDQHCSDRIAEDDLQRSREITSSGSTYDRNEAEDEEEEEEVKQTILLHYGGKEAGHDLCRAHEADAECRRI